MYKVSYDEIMQDDAQTLRANEQAAIDHAIDLMTKAQATGAATEEVTEAIDFVQKLWAFFIENLCDPGNSLDQGLKNDLISLGLWMISEADRILTDQSRGFATLIDINTTIRDGLK